MELTKDYVRGVLQEFSVRCEAVRDVGGVALKDVTDKTAVVPDGWVLDYETYYYIPQNLMRLLDCSGRIHKCKWLNASVAPF